MRNGMNSLAALIALIAVGLAAAQPAGGGSGSAPNVIPLAAAKPDPNSLEAMLAEALKHNPDIQVAEAKLHEAEAGLNKARVQVLQQLVTYKNAVDAQKLAVISAETSLKRQLELIRTGVTSTADAQKAEALLGQAKADLTKAEADLGMLMGKIPGHKDLSGVNFVPALRD